jgi:hypothetical protein
MVGTRAGSPVLDSAAIELASLRAQVAALVAAQQADQTMNTPVVAAPSTITAPLRGGILNGIAWTGGGTQTSMKQLASPASPDAYRPTDFRSMRSVYEKCVTGLAPESCYDTAATNTVSLVMYLNDIKTLISQTGQDGVFLIQHQDGIERSLLDFSGMFTSQEAEVHAQELMTNGDEYDKKNLVSSGLLMMKTIGPTLKGEIQKSINSEASKTGPVIFMLIIERIVTSSSQTWRNMINELQKLRLSQEPGENVEAFASKVDHLCRTLEGANQLPPDAAVLVSQCFMASAVEVFKIKFMTIFGELDSQPKKYKWQEVVSQATRMYHTLKLTEGNWSVAVRAPPHSLPAAVVLKEGGASTSSNCHSCGKPGHFSRNCPNNGNGGGGKDPWKNTAPAAGQPETMIKFDKNYYWCGTCKAWNLSHVTDKHVAGASSRGGRNRGGNAPPQAPSPVQAPATQAASLAPTLIASVPSAPVASATATNDQAHFSLIPHGGFMCSLEESATEESAMAVLGRQVKRPKPEPALYNEAREQATLYYNSGKFPDKENMDQALFDVFMKIVEDDMMDRIDKRICAAEQRELEASLAAGHFIVTDENMKEHLEDDIEVTSGADTPDGHISLKD